METSKSCCTEYVYYVKSADINTFGITSVSAEKPPVLSLTNVDGNCDNSVVLGACCGILLPQKCYVMPH